MKIKFMVNKRVFVSNFPCQVIFLWQKMNVLEQKNKRSDMELLDFKIFEFQVENLARLYILNKNLMQIKFEVNSYGFIIL